MAFTSTGNIEQAKSATNATIAADWARNAFRSSSRKHPTATEAASPTTTRAANSQRSTESAGSISVPTMARAYTDTTANRASAITCKGTRRRTARARSSLPSGAFRAVQAAPAARNIARPRRPVSSVKGVTRPSRGTPA